MLRTTIIFCLLILPALAFSQQLDSIYFNLYTDSLKKGTYNYINVEGRFSDGTYLPLGEKELKFSASRGSFSGNSLFIDSNITVDKVKVTVVARKHPHLVDEIEIYIKKYENQERLPTKEEVLKGRRRR